jgi:uncharacterized phiE125 gp8 family phage protein
MIPLPELRAYLREPPANDNALLQDLETAAVAAVERVTGRHFGEPREVVEVWREGRTFWMRDPPVDGEPVTVQPDDQPAPLTEGTEYERAGRRIDLLAPITARSATVTYTAGYDEGEEPADIRQAVRMLVAHWFINREAAVLGTIAMEVPHGVDAILSRYRTVRL